ncbi:uncharacterized protein LOC113637909 [Tachysurus fulvidraco]|uniref:uncharacterized protein LOC113637909 n=1 Tax=Tachysurus fulvidraco TaxID=1234273 RepID=UPI001FEF8D3C|nr:uncharacterized protein LOC113637909 [Tachysurus fulvidraco]
MSGRNKREKKNGLKKKPPKTYSRGELGESIFESSPDFNLDDPDMKLMNMEYNSLHDPHLKLFFNQRGKKQHLKKLGLITHDNKVLCTLKEFRDYMRYREAFHLSCEKYLLEKQKYLLKHFMMLKQKGEMPETISVSDMINWLINKGMGTFRKMYKQNIEAGSNPYYDEVLWKVRQHLQLEKMWKEVVRELRLERRFQDRNVRLSKKPLKKPVRTELTSKVDSTSRSLPPPVLQTVQEEKDESSLAFPHPRVSVGSVGIINKISSESPGESANVMDEISSIFDSTPKKGPLTSIRSISLLSSPSSESPKDEVQTAVLEELNRIVTEISAPCFMLDTEDSKNHPVDDFELEKDIEVVTLDDSVAQASTSQVESSSVHTHVSRDVSKITMDKVISFLSQTEVHGSTQVLETETEKHESKIPMNALLSEAMVKDLVKNMVEELVQYDIQQKMSFRDELQPTALQTSQFGDQHAHEGPSDLSSDTSESLSLPNNLTKDIVKSALDRVSVVITEKEALFSQQKSDKSSMGSASSSNALTGELDGSVESLTDSNNPLTKLASHLHLETKTALYETLQGIQSKIESGDLSDLSAPTVSPENVGMIMDLITEIVRVCIIEEETSDVHSLYTKEMGNTPGGRKRRRQKPKHDFFKRVWRMVKQVITTSGKRSN